ncbi:hypothetical protein HOC01_06500 [archaeon]|jgi:hypothetical protein|nr:hypothetical protein [archaeon]MBT6697509.1 hypothetical protein [archaeon]
MVKRPVVGLTENIILLSKNQNQATKQLIARIDTGATLSSIDQKLAKELELGPVIREKIVKQQTGKTRRPVIKATITIKNLKITDEFSVADRKNMKFPVLIGQNILKKGAFMVDPLIK